MRRRRRRTGADEMDEYVEDPYVPLEEDPTILVTMLKRNYSRKVCLAYR